MLDFTREEVVAKIDAGESLEKANLQGIDLRRAGLSEANLRGANLREADLRGADLIGADLREANLKGANLRGAKYNYYTQFPEGFDKKAAGMEWVGRP